jgi:protein involved in sex pheromone biosynthesis
VKKLLIGLPLIVMLLSGCYMRVHDNDHQKQSHYKDEDRQKGQENSRFLQNDVYKKLFTPHINISN